MKFSRNQIDELVYSDLFDSPVKIGRRYFCLPGREKLINLRKKRKQYSLEKEKIAIEKSNFLKKIPSVEAIFLTGSVAVGNAKKNADIDLMIVTSTNTLWITRFFVFTVLKSLKLLRSLKDQKDLICPNIFVDLNHLEIKDKNLYTAHEILQAKPLFDRGEIYKKWLKENGWVKKYLPDAYRFKNKQIPISNSNEHQFPKTNSQIWVLEFGYWTLELVIGFLIILEFPVFIFQYLYMKPHMTNERVGWGYAFFHPNNLSKTIPEKFRKRLLKYKGK